MLNDQFNVILFTNNVAICDKKTEQVGFVIPVDYFCFLRSLNIKYDENTSLENIFEFDNPEDMNKMKEYVRSQRNPKLIHRV